MTRKLMFALVLISAALLFGATAAQATTSPAVATSETGSYLSFSGNQSIGWEFQADEDLVVTHLGLWDDYDDGFLRPEYEIGLFRVSDQALLTPFGLTVQSTDPLQDHFRYVALTVPISLTGGQNYIVAVYSGAAGELAPHYIDDNPIGSLCSYDSRLTLLGEHKTNAAGSLVFPDEWSAPGYQRIGPTFRIEDAGSSTELSSWGKIKTLFR